MRSFYDHIAPREHVAGVLEAWYEENLRDHFVVGVNVSTGNGQFARGGKWEGRVNVRMFDNRRRFLRTIETACDLATSGLPGFIRDRYKVFFATDSSPMAELLSRLSSAVTRRSVFPPPGVGRNFGDYGRIGYTDRESAADTIIDMLLLARCHALIRNESRFSNYALVSTDHFNGNVRNLESLLPGPRAGARVRAIVARARTATSASWSPH